MIVILPVILIVTLTVILTVNSNIILTVIFTVILTIILTNFYRGLLPESQSHGHGPGNLTGNLQAVKGNLDNLRKIDAELQVERQNTVKMVKKIPFLRCFDLKLFKLGG